MYHPEDSCAWRKGLNFFFWYGRTFTVQFLKKWVTQIKNTYEQFIEKIYKYPINTYCLKIIFFICFSFIVHRIHIISIHVYIYWIGRKVLSDFSIISYCYLQTLRASCRHDVLSSLNTAEHNPQQKGHSSHHCIQLSKLENQHWYNTAILVSSPFQSSPTFLISLLPFLAHAQFRNICYIWLLCLFRVLQFESLSQFSLYFMSFRVLRNTDLTFCASNFSHLQNHSWHVYHRKDVLLFSVHDIILLLIIESYARYMSISRSLSHLHSSV